MALPLKPPLLPQLARPAKKLPTGDGWAYEPKWDGFRALAFVDGADVYLQSRSGRPLRRYFPELEFPPGRYVLAEQTPSRYIAFDLLAHEDEVLIELPQRERRARLEQLVSKPVDLTPCTT